NLYRGTPAAREGRQVGSARARRSGRGRERKGMLASPSGLELRRLLTRFLAVCSAIHYAHSRGVTHRDIKPKNILLGSHGETLILDWGLAKTRGEDGRLSQEGPVVLSPGAGESHTQTGATVGTPAYMSPEQAAGDLETVGPRSDVYSLGATLYSVMTGRAP